MQMLAREPSRQQTISRLDSLTNYQTPKQQIARRPLAKTPTSPPPDRSTKPQPATTTMRLTFLGPLLGLLLTVLATETPSRPHVARQMTRQELVARAKYPEFFGRR